MLETAVPPRDPAAASEETDWLAVMRRERSRSTTAADQAGVEPRGAPTGRDGRVIRTG